MTETQDQITTIDEVVVFLKDQHTKIKDLLPTVLQAEGAERSTAFALVRQTLAVHEAIEQVIVHPHARADAGGEVVAERVDEEEEAGDAIAELEALDVDDKAFSDAYAAFMLDVIEHAEHEEHEEFNQISHRFTDAELAQVERGVALTRSGYDAPTAELTFAQMLENAKQAVAG